MGIGPSKKVPGGKTGTYGRNIVSRPSAHGTRLFKRAGRKRSPETVKRMKAIVKAKRATIANEILSVYKPNWSNIPEANRQSRSGIAQWLLRKAQVPSAKGTVIIVELLEVLAKRKKISLPAKKKRKKPVKKKK